MRFNIVSLGMIASTLMISSCVSAFGTDAFGHSYDVSDMVDAFGRTLKYGADTANGATEGLGKRTYLVRRKLLREMQRRADPTANPTANPPAEDVLAVKADPPADNAPAVKNDVVVIEEEDEADESEPDENEN